MPLTDSLREAVLREALPIPGTSFQGVAVVIDTNVILDLIFWKDPAASDLMHAMDEGLVTPLRDRESMIELAEVLSRPHFLASEAAAVSAVAAWCARTTPVDEDRVSEAGHTITVRCRDPLDQKFLVLALAGRSPLLVTKDKLVLKAGKKMGRYGTRAVRPEDVKTALETLRAAA